MRVPITWFVTMLLAGLLVGGCASARAERPASSSSSSSAKGMKSVRETGDASYYAHKYHGRKTASGERFDMNALTAAHKTLPFGTKVKVTNLENGKTVTVRITDRGPFVKGRIIDLSLAAAKKIDMVKAGVVNVEIRTVGGDAVARSD